MSGYRDKTGKISTYLCGSFILSTRILSFEQMIYFFSSGPDSYKRNCACKEIMGPYSKPELFDPKKGCKIPKESGNRCNYRQTGLCKREGGMCSWKNVECEKA
ncbi:uncharacterized protein [Mytilus edulis]|uniref:uncharacterized protein n=1 Tax=Mytilus edulis TaxID=6550 RepID=UPI0039F0B5FE